MEFDYEEEERFYESIKHLPRKEIEKLYDKKYGGQPLICQLCFTFVIIAPISWCIDGVRCSDCYEFWDKQRNNKLDLKLLLERAKREKAKKCWQSYIDEKNKK